MRDKINEIVDTTIQGLYGIGAEVAHIFEQNPDMMINGLNIDFIHFILYLAGADGEFTASENKYIRGRFDKDVEIDDWKEYIRSLDFDINKPKLPLTFDVFVKADNFQYNNDNSIASAVESFISCFKIVGEVFIGVDGEVSNEEVERLTAFLDMLQSYYEEHTDRINVNKHDPVDVDLANKIVSPIKDSKNYSVGNSNLISHNSKCFSVRFFDKEYNVPEDALTFLQCREFVSNGLLKLLDESTKLMNKYSRMKSENAFRNIDKDVNRIQKVMLSVVDKVLDDLLKRDIYDVDKYELNKIAARWPAKAVT